jgi:Reverse transcriptase (RNA-dependent DNA polymerase)
MAQKMNVPACLISIIRNMYIANKGHIHINGEQEAYFKANIGVKQGDETSPKLFSIFFD